MPDHLLVPTVIIEDSPNIRASIRTYLEKHFAHHIQIIGEGGHVDKSAAMIRELRPQLVLLFPFG
ncbi:MAG: hypothetical protein ACOVSW_22485 [Candidatus Kapaibacteriota bacterium]